MGENPWYPFMASICTHMDMCIKRPMCMHHAYTNNTTPKLSSLCLAKRTTQHKIIEIGAGEMAQRG